MRHLTYGMPQDKGGTHIQMGVAKGFFRDEGLHLNVEVTYGGPEIAAKYSSGALQIGEMGSPPATTALARGANFLIVGSGIRQRALQYFVARSDIRSWEDLAGKRIGVLSRGSCSYWFTQLLLRRHGMADKADIVGLGSDYPQVIDLVERDELQAAVLSEPTASIGEHRKAFRIMQALTEPEFCPGMQWSVIVANRDFIAAEPGTVRAVLRASTRSYEYARDHPDEFAEFAGGRYGVEPSVVKRSVAREAPGYRYDGAIDFDGLALAIEMQRRLGAFDVPLDTGAITDLRFLPQ
ncbi:NMT1/THI5 like protein [Pigmentiphaga humi]|uniref:NMT1/THI5 like protein n=1 Tax=Pigmentiphaga humi TaxID=2478468 RepID=A0A3P4B5T9_9BURK|nr:ABC transporter substrate-binding protein [Pigmentiphaga humi]VCU71674.1 NMT1/THI5 like protein [Pigmentiphaga humi]